MAGLRYRNSNKLWSAISGHNQLQSLSVEVEDLDKNSNHLDGWLSEGLLPPSCLERLTLVGKLFSVTEWIHKLQSLSKVVLHCSGLEEDDAMPKLILLIKHKDLDMLIPEKKMHICLLSTVSLIS